ncbi:MAG: signal peptidase I [Saprospiraceae bacterium]|nr:signal peptidase I [Saprospiraceae bacterium]
MKVLFNIIIFSLCLGFGIKTYIFEVFTVPTDSMTPTIAVGQKVWLCKWSFKPQKDDVVGFEKNGEYFVKRIIGMPLDSVHTEGGLFRVGNGKRFVSNAPLLFFKIPKKGDTVILDKDNFSFYQPLIEKEGNQAGLLFDKMYINGSEATSYIFKQNYYFVQGDNLNHSEDSRHFGLIGEKKLLGWWVQP